MREFLSRVPGLCDPPEPYSYSVRAGQTIYLAGQVALDEDMQVVGTTMPEQADQVWNNIRSVLAASSATLADIVKINYFLRDIRELSDEIAIRETLFAADKMPSVTAVQVAALGLPGLMMEVDIIEVLEDE